MNIGVQVAEHFEYNSTAGTYVGRCDPSLMITNELSSKVFSQIFLKYPKNKEDNMKSNHNDE